MITIETSVEFIKQVGDAINRSSAWKVSLEYPGFLQHAQEVGTVDELLINIGPSWTENEWTADYVRDLVIVGSWAIPASADDTPEQLAARIVEKLNTAIIEEEF
jgi:hypothetical protein